MENAEPTPQSVQGYPCAPPPSPLRATQHCRHYSYKPGAGPQCAAGCALPASVLHCLPAPRETCPKREEYTAEERAVWRAYREERMARLILIMARVPGTSRTKNDGRWGEVGSFNCPACGTGTVHWSRARSNGHLHARCTTPNCFDVIE